MIRASLHFIFLAFMFSGFEHMYSQVMIPRPDHVVIAMFENKSYSQIVGSPSAPFINSLIADTNAALFTQSYALTHPSQPNYLMLFSGSDQGVTNDTISTATPFTSCNLGASLLQAGFTFAGYCEDLPSAGFLGTNSGLYYRKHNPWSNWQGSLANNIAASLNQPFTAFTANYNLLPDVCFVVPNINNCMHNGTISLGDSWLQTNLDNYIQWTRTNNSLFILTFEEDNGSEGNRITTIFYGPMVNGGMYSAHIDHYNVLRTLEDMYNLPYCGNSSSATAIDYIWKPVVAITENKKIGAGVSVFPNPASDHVLLKLFSESNIKNATIEVEDVFGNEVLKSVCNLHSGENVIYLSCCVSSGIYMLTITSKDIHQWSKLVIE